MPRSADNHEPNGTLPHPELNPLINPVLGAHMGRWAEVYFTSPPERREAAVLDLLRELEGETPPQNEVTASKPAQPQAIENNLGTQPPRGAEVDQSAQAWPSEKESTFEKESTGDREWRGREVSCPSCGQTNPEQHKFCGMCGADIHQSRSLNSPIVDPEEEQVNAWRMEEPSDAASGPALAGVSAVDTNPFGLSWGSDEGPRLLPEPEAVPYRYRVYVGAALAILLSTLGYMAWRGANAGFGTSHTLPPAAPVASPEAQTNVPAKSEPPAANSAAPAKREDAPATATKGSVSGSAARTQPNSAPDSAPANAPAPVTQAARGNGSEELNVAQTYLSGAHGKAQDSAEAAKWLWKSVAKENSSAALMLSDLYLRGNGVAKSCDQARVLLDAAARKGVAGAAERLRNLPAFGCQ